MVSIIIPEYKDDLYLIRCLNSIRRQNYKDTEILLINGRCGTAIIDKYNLKIVETNNVEDNGLNKAIVAAKGEYILFCNVSTILASNTLTELMKDVDNAFTYVNGYVLKEEEFQSRKDFMLSCYGKLFQKSKLLEHSIAFSGNNILSEYAFVIKYAACFKNIKFREDICIYETEPEALSISNDTCTNITQWQECFDAIRNSVDEIASELKKGLIERIRENAIYSEELAHLAEKEFHTDYELNYVCEAPILKQLWYDVKENKDLAALEDFKAYLAKYENESLLSLLLGACGLKANYYEYIKNNELTNVLFLIEEVERMASENDEIFDTVRAIRNNQNAGLVKIGAKWYYHSNGRLDKTYNGMAKNPYGWWYISNGTIDYSYEGLCRNPYGWWYISNGTINKEYTGLAMNEAGMWMYVENGAVNKEFTALIETKSGYRYISDGVINREYRGLVKDVSGKWMYVENGTVNTNFIGLVKNDYGWWYVEDGTINFEYNGYAKNYLGWCKVENGKGKPEEQPELKPEQSKEKDAVDINIVRDSEENADIPEDTNMSETTVDFFRNGQLGFRTIVKSVGAWMKCKLKHDRD